MIEATIDVLPHGDASRRRRQVVIAIWNDLTGDEERGNYRWLISHQIGSAFGDSAAAATGVAVPTARDLIDRPEWVWRRGSVKGIRRSRGSGALLAAVLRSSAL